MAGTKRLKRAFCGCAFVIGGGGVGGGTGWYKGVRLNEMINNKTLKTARIRIRVGFDETRCRNFAAGTPYLPADAEMNASIEREIER